MQSLNVVRARRRAPLAGTVQSSAVAAAASARRRPRSTATYVPLPRTHAHSAPWRRGGAAYHAQPVLGLGRFANTCMLVRQGVWALVQALGASQGVSQGRLVMAAMRARPCMRRTRCVRLREGEVRGGPPCRLRASLAGTVV